jgi:hypothetical protein
LPFSPKALSETKQLQQLASSISLDDQDKDSWAYPWGAVYTSKKKLISVSGTLSLMMLSTGFGRLNVHLE